MFQKIVNTPQYLVIEEKGKVVGVTGYISSWMDYHTYELFWVNVAPEYQGRGLGKKLVASVLKEIKKIRGRDEYACVILLGTKIPSFYKQFKFKTLMRFNKRKHHLMALSLE
jgi:N-acetylglutamate synthase-like GNAT family acetyltransferase